MIHTYNQNMKNMIFIVYFLKKFIMDILVIKSKKNFFIMKNLKILTSLSLVKINL